MEYIYYAILYVSIVNYYELCKIKYFMELPFLANKFEFENRIFYWTSEFF